jgi:hypothetical protein
VAATRDSVQPASKPATMTMVSAMLLKAVLLAVDDCGLFAVRGLAQHLGCYEFHTRDNDWLGLQMI